jgi:WD40 repeat protein
MLATGCKDKRIKLWDSQTGEVVETLSGGETRLEAVVFSPDGRTLASGSGGPESLVVLWPLARLRKYEQAP